jgi:imidazolonepropionase-like amidohydrolase
MKRPDALCAALLVVLIASSLATSLLHSQQQSLAFTHLTVIDGTGAAPTSDTTVIVSGDRIVARGPTGRVAVPDGASVVDATGKFLIPGLWDMHVHAFSHENGRKVLPRLLAYGITGVRDMASAVDDVIRLKRETADGTMLGPQMIVAGPILQGPLPFQLPPHVLTVTDGGAQSAVSTLVAKGVDFIKVGDTLTRDAYFGIAEKSRSLGVPFAGHLTPAVTVSEAVRAGQRSIEHFGSAGFRNMLVACSTQEREFGAYLQNALATARAGGGTPDSQVYRAEFTTRLVESYDAQKAAALFALLARSGTWQVPTLLALQDVWSNAKKQLGPSDAAAADRVALKTMEMFAGMRAAGVRIMAGSDLAASAGEPALHDELVSLVNAGLTSMEALQAATRSPAEFLGRLPTEGTIEVGKQANLVVLDANPLADIRNTRRVSMVVRAGKLLREADLQKMR